MDRTVWTRTLTCWLVVAAVAWRGSAAGMDTAAADPEVAKGIQQATDGDYDGAIVTLDGATRRLAARGTSSADLAQANVYLGIAYLAKGQDAAARARFKEAIRQSKDLTLAAGRFPPKVIDAFEAARGEMAPPAAPAGSHRKTLLIAGGIVAAGGGIAVAAATGGKSAAPAPPGVTTTTFPNQVVVFGGGKGFLVDVNGSGTLAATVSWIQDGVPLAMYVVNAADPTKVISDASKTGAKELTLSIPVAAGSYKISVTNDSGFGPHVDTTFTLTVVHP